MWISFSAFLCHYWGYWSGVYSGGWWHCILITDQHFHLSVSLKCDRFMLVILDTSSPRLNVFHSVVIESYDKSNAFISNSCLGLQLLATSMENVPLQQTPDIGMRPVNHLSACKLPELWDMMLCCVYVCVCTEEAWYFIQASGPHQNVSLSFLPSHWEVNMWRGEKLTRFQLTLWVSL